MRCKNFYYKDDELLCDGLKIKKIVQEYSTPVFIYSELHIRENLNQIQIQQFRLEGWALNQFDLGERLARK